ncbi:MAG: ribonuclease HI [Clostridia bacterium]|nr:ribonuclease HI [Clostridia bacterium]
MERKNVTIYTDGACSGNPGNGGWGTILMYNNHKKELSGGEQNTTNNRMELLAAIKGLELLKEPCNVSLYSDSAYMVNAFLQDWVGNWKKNNYRGADKKEIKNLDLWKRLLALTETHNVTFIKVKGHADNEFNNRCDLLATSAIERISE